MSFKVNHLHFKTPDPSKTAQFYVDLLGATVVSQNTADDGRPSSFRLDLHGIPMNVTGWVAGQQLEQHYGLEHIALDTDEFDTMRQRLLDEGAKILEERNLGDGRRVTFFEGPEGVRLEIMEGIPQ